MGAESDPCQGGDMQHSATLFSYKSMSRSHLFIVYQQL